MAIDLDLSGVGLPEFETVAEGEATFAVTEAEQKSKDGKDSLVVTLTCISHSTDPESVDRNIKAFFQLDRDKLKWLRAFLEAVLQVSLEGAQLSDFIDDWSELCGKTVGGNVVKKGNYTNVGSYFIA